MLGNRTGKALAAGAVVVASEYASLPVNSSTVADATPVALATVEDNTCTLREALE